jgi:hypothetical protein
MIHQRSRKVAAVMAGQTGGVDIKWNPELGGDQESPIQDDHGSPWIVLCLGVPLQLQRGQTQNGSQECRD